MYKRIDEDDSSIDGYCFEDEDGMEVYVSIPYDRDSFGKNQLVDVGVDGNTEFTIYSKDIPKLIKALEAAYKHEVIHNHKEA